MTAIPLSGAMPTLSTAGAIGTAPPLLATGRRESATGGDVDLGCGGAEVMCCEPSGASVSEGNLFYVGKGGGVYEMVQTVQYVGAGGSYDREKVITNNGWRCRLWCIIVLFLLVLLGIGLLVWWLTPQQEEARDASVDSASSELFDCDAGYWNWEKGWSEAKKGWCCHHKSRGCLTTTTGQPYDCHAGLSNWEAGWARGKQLWCCAVKNLGCPRVEVTTSLPFDCDAGYSNWHAGWSPAKKSWCCSHSNRGCVVSDPYDCDAGFSNWQSGWSVSKKQWCCVHKSRGCAEKKSCSLWGDPHIFTFDHSRLVFYSEGDFWVVKSATLQVQGRFQATDWTKKNDKTDYSSMTQIIIGGSLVQNRKIQIGPMGSGEITCDGEAILKYYGSKKCGGATVTFGSQGDLVDNAMSFLPHKVVHMYLPSGVVIQVNRWPNFINAKIMMQPITGQTGICGDFNGVKKAALRAGKELHAQFGYGVPAHELLFASSIPLHIPTASPSNKRCSPAKRHKAQSICEDEAESAPGWSVAECLGDVCDPHTGGLTSFTAEEMKALTP